MPNPPGGQKPGQKELRQNEIRLEYFKSDSRELQN